MDDGTAQRLAGNEAFFRKVNEAIKRGQWPGEETAPIAFRCECARMGCNQLIVLTLADYERVRADAERFMVLPGHELPELERVVETWPGYVVVLKLEAAAELARASDPRD
jgi:hypothetical protein